MGITSIRSAPLRVISSEDNVLYLTFDDGPDNRATPQVLEILAGAKVKATFFLVAERAAKHKALLEAIRSQGHQIGNHSLDHGYAVFFQGRRRLLKWIDDSERVFAELGVSRTVGFRPPAGVVTPELKWALGERKMPLVLWERRFYDTVFRWSSEKAIRSLRTTPKGSIVLLHDCMRSSLIKDSGRALIDYIKEAQRIGFRFDALTTELCRTGI